jgi:lysophospholipase L1-like esterase
VAFSPAPTVVSSSFPYKYRSSKGILVTNCGINGQGWREMDGQGTSGETATDVDGAYDTAAGMQNALITWAFTNEVILKGLNLAQAVQYATDYVAHRRQAHPWTKILTGTCIPRMNTASNQAQVDADNALLDKVNAYLLANYKAMGFDGVFDVRKAGTYFDMQGDYSIAHFNAMASATGTYWASSTNESPSTSHVHLNSDGYWYIATQFIVPLLQAI